MAAITPSFTNTTPFEAYTHPTSGSRHPASVALVTIRFLIYLIFSYGGLLSLFRIRFLTLGSS